MKKISISIVLMLGIVSLLGAAITPAANDKWRIGTASVGALFSSDCSLSNTGDITVGDDLTVTDDAAVGGNLTVTGTTTVTGGSILPVVSTTTAPSAAGILAVNSVYTVYVSTDTNAGDWVAVGGQS